MSLIIKRQALIKDLRTNLEPIVQRVPNDLTVIAYKRPDNTAQYHVIHHEPDGVIETGERSLGRSYGGTTLDAHRTYSADVSNFP